MEIKIWVSVGKLTLQMRKWTQPKISELEKRLLSSNLLTINCRPIYCMASSQCSHYILFTFFNCEYLHSLMKLFNEVCNVFDCTVFSHRLKINFCSNIFRALEQFGRKNQAHLLSTITLKAAMMLLHAEKKFKVFGTCKYTVSPRGPYTHSFRRQTTFLSNTHTCWINVIDLFVLYVCMCVWQKSSVLKCLLEKRVGKVHHRLLAIPIINLDANWHSKKRGIRRKLHTQACGGASFPSFYYLHLHLLGPSDAKKTTKAEWEARANGKSTVNKCFGSNLK